MEPHESNQFGITNNVVDVQMPQQLWDLICCLHQLGKDAPQILIHLTSVAQPQLTSDKIIPILGKMFEEIPPLLQQEHIHHLLLDPPPNYVTLRLLLSFRELQQLIQRMSFLQLLHLTNNIVPPGPSQAQLEFLQKAQEIFQSWSRDTLEHHHQILSETPLHMERQQLLQLEPHIPWDMLHFLIEILKLPLEELQAFQSWIRILPKMQLAMLVLLLQMEPSALLEIKQRMDPIGGGLPLLDGTGADPHTANNPSSLSRSTDMLMVTDVAPNTLTSVSAFGTPQYLPSPPATPSQFGMTPMPPTVAPTKVSSLAYSTDTVNNFQLRIARQPPNRTVYQRILKPFPSVMLVGTSSDAVSNNNLFVEASLLRSDSDVELPTAIEGNRIVRISNGVFAVFKKLKILSTSQQQGSLFRLRFALKRYVGNVFEHIPSAVVHSNPIEVFSHTLYLNERVESAPPPPIIHEILPTTGGPGTRVAILGTNFVNSPTLRVRIGDVEITSPNFHEQGTLVASVPLLPRHGTFPVRVSNDGSNFCETKVFFTYMQTS